MKQALSLLLVLSILGQPFVAQAQRQPASPIPQEETEGVLEELDFDSDEEDVDPSPLIPTPEQEARQEEISRLAASTQAFFPVLEEFIEPLTTQQRLTFNPSDLALLNECINWMRQRQAGPAGPSPFPGCPPDRRLIALLTWLVTPASRGGAGRERIRVDRIWRGFETSRGGRENPAHHLGQAVQISEIDLVRSTIVKRRRIGGKKTVPLRPTPIKVAWQTEEGVRREKPFIEPASFNELFRNGFRDVIADFLTEFEIDAEGDLSRLRNPSLRGIAEYLGLAALEQILALPRGGFEGVDFPSIIRRLGQAILAANTGLPIEGLRGNSLSEVEENLGRVTLEDKFGFGRSSMRVVPSERFPSAQQIRFSIGRAAIERELGLRPEYLQFDFRDESSFLRRLGQAAIESYLNLPRRSFDSDDLGEIRRRLGEQRFNLLFKEDLAIDEILGLTEEVTGGFAKPTQALREGRLPPAQYARWVGEAFRAYFVSPYRAFVAPGESPFADAYERYFQPEPLRPRLDQLDDRLDEAFGLTREQEGTIRRLFFEGDIRALEAIGEARIIRFFSTHGLVNETEEAQFRESIRAWMEAREGAKSLSEIGIPESTLMGSFELASGDLNRLFQDPGDARTVFIRIGKKRLQAALITRVKEEIRSQQSPLGSQISAGLAEIAATDDFYRGQLQLIADAAGSIAQQATDPETKQEAADLREQTLQLKAAASPGDFLRLASYLRLLTERLPRWEVYRIRASAEEQRRLDPHLSQLRTALVEITEGRKLAGPTAEIEIEFRANPDFPVSRRDIFDIFTGRRQIEDLVLLIGTRRIDLELGLPLGSLFAFAEAVKKGRGGADDFFVAVGRASFESRGIATVGMAESELRRTGERIVQTTAAIRLTRELAPRFFSEAGLSGHDVYLILSGQGQEVLWRIGGWQLDERLDLPPGFTERMLRARTSEERQRLLAEAALRRWGVFANLPLGFSLEGNLRDNVGRARIEQMLALPQGSFQGSFEEVGRRVGWTRLADAFRIPWSEIVPQGRRAREVAAKPAAQRSEAEAALLERAETQTKELFDALREEANWQQESSEHRIRPYVPRIAKASEDLDFLLGIPRGKTREFLQKQRPDILTRAVGDPTLIAFGSEIIAQKLTEAGAPEVATLLEIAARFFGNPDFRGRNVFCGAGERRGVDCWSDGDRLFIFDSLARFFKLNLAKEIGLPEDWWPTFNTVLSRLLLDPARAQETALEAGVIFLDAQLGSRGSLVCAYALASGRTPTFSPIEGQRLGEGFESGARASLGFALRDCLSPRITETAEGVAVTTVSGRALRLVELAGIREIQRRVSELTRTDRFAGVFIPEDHAQAIIRGDLRIFLYISAARLVQEINTADGRGLLPAGLQVSYDDVIAAFGAPPSREELARKRAEFELEAYQGYIEGRTRPPTLAECQADKEGCGKFIETQAASRLDDWQAERKRERHTNLFYKALDAAIWRIEEFGQFIPPGFARKMIEGSEKEKVEAAQQFLFAWALDETQVGRELAKLGLDVGAARDIARCFSNISRCDPSRFSEGIFTALTNGIARITGIEDWSINLTKSLVAFAATGNLDEGLGRLPSVTHAFRDYGIFKLSHWLDRRLGLSPGTSATIFQRGREYFAAVKAYKVAVDKLTIARGNLNAARASVVEWQRRLDQAREARDAAAIAEAEANLSSAQQQEAAAKTAKDGAEAAQTNAKARVKSLQAAAITFALTTVFAKQLASFERQLNLVPGTLSILVGGIVEALVLGTVPIIGLILFIAINLFGYYKIEIVATADGYYPFIGRLGLLSPFPLPWGQYPLPESDQETGRFRADKPRHYQAGLMRAAQAKVRGLLRDVLSVADRTGRRPLLPTQIGTWRREDIEALIDEGLVLRPDRFERPPGLGYNKGLFVSRDWAGFTPETVYIAY